MTKNLSTKTFIISMTLIIILGGVFVFGLSYFTNPPGPKTNWQDNLPVSIPPRDFSLEVSDPDDGSLIFDKQILVSGKTSPGATVIVSTDNDDLVADVDKNGQFSKTISLESGLNHLIISSFNARGDNKQITRVVYYSEEKI